MSVTRYTERDAQKAFERLCEVLDKRQGHYRELSKGETDPGQINAKYATIPGGWALDYNPTYAVVS